MVFELIGVDASIANAIRRVLIAEVPTMAISPSLAELQRMSGNKKAEYLTVYSKSLELQRVGKQEELPEGTIGLVNDDIILIKLAPGQVPLKRTTDM